MPASSQSAWGWGMPENASVPVSSSLQASRDLVSAAVADAKKAGASEAEVAMSLKEALNVMQVE